MFDCVPTPHPSGHILFFFLISKTGLEAAWPCSTHQKHFLKHMGDLVIIDMSLMFDFQSCLSSGLLCQENQKKEAWAAGSCPPSPGFIVCRRSHGWATNLCLHPLSLPARCRSTCDLPVAWIFHNKFFILDQLTYYHHIPDNIHLQLVY